ncbi:transcriptional repressor LexA [Sansalvadorimonas sp. 2012CJ34-2]|uniref:LexA repressor n=1 Tax=Parendozoicomonas callyspongiae TaxID=2942213 RepID=A0ABT0PEK1_9GAMM|nr:transcriptional repressor LexA [Sansalvadorimonas sp. 2012CJ34-2]MCL6269802.1 transcriptional repressor LexA [Sansalvadorimonas sp. 2012CJ34-2]
MIKLTPRQSEILDFIKDHIDDTGFPPTRAEIARQLGFRSPNAAEDHLKALARKGAIEIIPGTSRGIRIPAGSESKNDEQGLPVIGQVAAGAPILAQEHIDSHCQLNPDFFHPKADYLLKVCGMSMKNIGILDGDLLAVHKTTDVHNGQVVVARIDEEVTVKRFERKKNMVWLHPENEDFEPIVVDLTQEHLEIEGLSVGVIRH